MKEESLRISGSDAMALYELCRYMLHPYLSNSDDLYGQKKRGTDMINKFCYLLSRKTHLDKVSAMIQGISESKELGDVFYNACGFENYGYAYVDVYNDYGFRGFLESSGCLMGGIFAARAVSDYIIYQGVSLDRACEMIDEKYLNYKDLSDEVDVEDIECELDNWEDGYENEFDDEEVWRAAEGLSDREATCLAKKFADDYRALKAGRICSVDDTSLYDFYKCVCYLVPSYEENIPVFLEDLEGLLVSVFIGGGCRMRSHGNKTENSGYWLHRRKGSCISSDTEEWKNWMEIRSGVRQTTYGRACVGRGCWIHYDYGDIYSRINSKEDSALSDMEKAFLWAADTICMNRYFMVESLMKLSRPYVDKDGALVFSRVYPEETNTSDGNCVNVGPSIAEIFAPLIFVSLADCLLSA